MSLADQLNKPMPDSGGLPCSVAQFIAALPNELERAAFDEFLYGTHPQLGRPFYAREILAAIVADNKTPQYGYPEVRFRSINRHRSGMCRCGERAR